MKEKLLNALAKMDDALGELNEVVGSGYSPTDSQMSELLITAESFSDKVNSLNENKELAFKLSKNRRA